VRWSEAASACIGLTAVITSCGTKGPPVRNVTVPLHGGKTLKRATLAAIIKQAGLTVEAFAALLR
jgi:hypothetical protein